MVIVVFRSLHKVYGNAFHGTFQIYFADILPKSRNTLTKEKQNCFSFYLFNNKHPLKHQDKTFYKYIKNKMKKKESECFSQKQKLE